MKKYMFCFLLITALAAVSLGIGFAVSKDFVKEGEAVPNATLETETAPDDHMVMNQEKVEPAMSKAPAYQYYLVSEDGYLLVLYQDKSTICLYTYVPVTEFPEAERAKLMEGIWFPTMPEVLNYLESYTS